MVVGGLYLFDPGTEVLIVHTGLTEKRKRSVNALVLRLDCLDVVLSCRVVLCCVVSCGAVSYLCLTT